MKKFAAIAGAALLAACGSEDSGTIETSEGTMEYSTDRADGDTTVTIKSAEGDVTIASGAGQKADLPDGFSVYPGATVLNSSSVNHSEGSGVRLMMSTDASPVQAADFYRKQAKAAGIADLTEMTAGGQIMLGGKSDDGTEFSFTANGNEGTTTINLFVAKGF